MSHSPTAQLGHGTGSGRRTMPATRSPAAEAARRARVEHAAERLVAQHEARLAGRRRAEGTRDDLRVGAADADGDGLHEHRAVARVRLRHLLEAHAARLSRLDGDRLHRSAAARMAPFPRRPGIIECGHGSKHRRVGRVGATAQGVVRDRAAHRDARKREAAGRLRAQPLRRGPDGQGAGRRAPQGRRSDQGGAGRLRRGGLPPERERAKHGARSAAHRGPAAGEQDDAGGLASPGGSSTRTST